MFFDIGPLELVALAVIALLVLGPDKLPRYAADAARVLRQVRRMASDAKAEVSRELGPELQDISMADLNPRSLVRKHLLDPVDLDDLEAHLDWAGLAPDTSGATAQNRMFFRKLKPTSAVCKAFAPASSRSMMYSGALGLAVLAAKRRLKSMIPVPGSVNV